jgi:hypothetical protein
MGLVGLRSRFQSQSAFLMHGASGSASGRGPSVGGRCCSLRSPVDLPVNCGVNLAIAVRALPPGPLWQSAGKWLQSIDACCSYLDFLTDQLLDYVCSTSLPLHVLRFSVLAAG